MEWKPIESAPRDGTEILLLVVGYRPATGIWLDGVGWFPYGPENFQSEETWHKVQEEWVDAGVSWEPDYWLPLDALPPPPVKEGAE